MLLAFAAPIRAQNLYFPPSSSTWDTLSPQSQGWCPTKIDSLLQFVGQAHSKAFIVLKSGKIVIEKYYGTFQQDSLWYWASAGKSLTATLVGIAQQNNLLSTSDTSSKYLGNNWTSCLPEKEKKITIRHQLTMTTGLNDAVIDPDCILPTCLQYSADAGTRWAYHNAPYQLLQNVVASASGQTFQQFTTQKIRIPLGMSSGIWFDGVFYSKARDMARFGLLSLAKGRWGNTTILSDTAYFRQMTNTSNTINPSYGYLWWLNGKNKFILPSSQFVFNSWLIPNAPADLFAALGKNDQKIYVVPSMDLVVVRMGNAAGQSALSLSTFDNVLWAKIMNLACSPTAVQELKLNAAISLYPNPVISSLRVDLPDNIKDFSIEIFSAVGQKQLESKSKVLDVSYLTSGLYLAKITTAQGIQSIRFMKE